MISEERRSALKRVLQDYMQSPSLQHLRDYQSIDKLATQIFSTLVPERVVWTKWSQDREAIVRAAAPCWVPLGELQAHLNSMPGPELTRTDVAQRIRAFEEDESRYDFPDPDHQAGCLQIYEAEMAQGTELIAIIGQIREFVVAEDERSRLEYQAHWKERQEHERQTLQARLVSGADCKWSALNGSKALYCRINGRLFKLSTAADKRFVLERVSSFDDPKGVVIGTYHHRKDVTLVLKSVPFQPDLIG